MLELLTEEELFLENYFEELEEPNLYDAVKIRDGVIHINKQHRGKRILFGRFTKILTR